MRKRLFKLSTVALMVSMMFGTVAFAADETETTADVEMQTIEECADEQWIEDSAEDATASDAEAIASEDIEDVEEDMILATTGWKQEGAYWYYYNANGVKVTGWQAIGGKWYYFKSSGAMVTGWQAIGSKWYYFNASGAMATGWQKLDNKWYYFNASGAMATGWQKLDNKWYYFNTSGAMQTGWQKLDNKWYYFETSGKMVTGWKLIEDSCSYYDEYMEDYYYWDEWFYFDANGRMVTGWQQLGKDWYYFFPSATEYSSKGAMAMSFEKINGKWYFFGDNGKMRSNGWANYWGDWIYTNANGTCVTGWKQIGGKWYYFDPDWPQMATYCAYIDGQKNWFTEDGVWIGKHLPNNYITFNPSRNLDDYGYGNIYLKYTKVEYTSSNQIVVKGIIINNTTKAIDTLPWCKIRIVDENGYTLTEKQFQDKYIGCERFGIQEVTFTWTVDEEYDIRNYVNGYFWYDIE